MGVGIRLCDAVQIVVSVQLVPLLARCFRGFLWSVEISQQVNGLVVAHTCSPPASPRRNPSVPTCVVRPEDGQVFQVLLAGGYAQVLGTNTRSVPTSVVDV